jgi:hypothetical protein
MNWDWGLVILGVCMVPIAAYLALQFWHGVRHGGVEDLPALSDEWKEPRDE